VGLRAKSLEWRAETGDCSVGEGVREGKRDGGTERQRDGGTEGWRDGETEGQRY
jgi:hypothetical protein